MKRIWVGLGVRASLVAACITPAWAAEPVSFDAAMQKADERFVAGDLAGALQLLEPICAGTDRPECAFSLGAVHHGLGHCVHALALYRRYLELAPGGDRVAEVREALEEVEGRCGKRVIGPGSPVTPGAPQLPAPVPGQPAAIVTVKTPPGSAAAAAVEPAPRSLSADLAVGSLALAGVAALSSVAFGVLAARDANRCAQAQAYDSEFVERCENAGPRYQGLWQGFAVASVSFLGVGVALLAFDTSQPGASAPAAQLSYQGRF